MKKYLNATVAASALTIAMMTGGAAIAQSDIGAGESGETAEEESEFRFRAQSGDINPFYGDINPFYGDINPFYGDISPFWGDISPFWGDISPFRGDINPFQGDIHPWWGDIGPFRGDIDPFYGDIAPFWGDIGPFWGDIYAQWGDIQPFDDANLEGYQQLAEDLNTMFARAEEVFGEVVEDETHSSFREGFLNPLLERYGFDPEDLESLQGMTDHERSAFFLDFYDGLMNFLEMDRVDHWMASVRWSPALSQAAGEGKHVEVGVVDFSLPQHATFNTHDEGLRDYLGVNHGYAVAGIIAARHDEEGVMGLAPDADLTVYNPFDESHTAGWQDVRDALAHLLPAKEDDRSDVINLSLGVDGWTFHYEWANIFGGGGLHTDTTLFVMAAGNSGTTQTTDVDWTAVGQVNNLLLVGSVSPNGEISHFSNRPGTACLTVLGACPEGHRLMDRFLVAPGELILVSDDSNDGEGLVRMSGTSFSAPIVTGAAALVLSRWEWLEAHDVADVLLRSARDLGAPGVDEVYGHGLLDVEASLSPFSGEDLYFFTSKNEARDVPAIGLIYRDVDFSPDEDDSVVVFQALNDTYRDFEIPLSELVENTDAAAHDAELNSAANLAERIYTYGGGTTSFTDIAVTSRIMSGNGDMRVSAFASPSDPMEMSTADELPFQAGISVENTASGREMRFGFGEGALAFSSNDGFGLFSDYRPDTGGVNPILGLASGGAYGMVRMGRPGENQIAFGMTSTEDEMVYVDPFSGAERQIMEDLNSYQAAALALNYTRSISESVQVNLGYTYLHEGTGMLGAQGAGPLAMEGGTQTDALTFSAEGELGSSTLISFSGTIARTREGGFNGDVMAVSEAPLSTAFQVSAQHHGLFGETDAIRVSLIQPMHVETGSLSYSVARVVDRESGEMASSTQEWQLGGERTLMLETLYGASLMNDQLQLNLFSRFDFSSEAGSADEPSLASGIRVRFDF